MSSHVQLEEFWPNCLDLFDHCLFYGRLLKQEEVARSQVKVSLVVGSTRCCYCLPEFLGCSRHCVNEHCHDEGAMSFSANLLSLFVFIKSEIFSYVDC